MSNSKKFKSKVLSKSVFGQKSRLLEQCGFFKLSKWLMDGSFKTFLRLHFDVSEDSIIF